MFMNVLSHSNLCKPTVLAKVGAFVGLLEPLEEIRLMVHKGLSGCKCLFEMYTIAVLYFRLNPGVRPCHRLPLVTGFACRRLHIQSLALPVKGFSVYLLILVSHSLTPFLPAIRTGGLLLPSAQGYSLTNRKPITVIASTLPFQCSMQQW